MANNKLHGYTPKTVNEKDGNRLDKFNPYEFRRGMDYEKFRRTWWVLY